MNTTKSWVNKKAAALSAVLKQLKPITRSIGYPSYALTTATTPAACEGFYATDVTSSPVKAALQRFSKPQQNTFETEGIASIEYAGEEEVFDIQVERTENFIANGVVSHNTRWHDDDLSGWQLRMDKENKEEDLPEEYLQNWKVLSFPAIAEQDEYIHKDTHEFFEEPGEKRVCVRRAGQALHPARYTKNYLLRKRFGSGMPDNQWSALYQQNPIPASGEFFREEDFVYYDQPPQLHQYPVLFSWDLAIGLKRENDYTVGAAGVVIPRGGINEVFLLDSYRNRVRDTEQLEAIVNMYARYKDNAYRIGIEQGQIWLAIEMRLRALFKQRNLTPVFDPELKPVQDKRVRATPLQGWMQNHRVWFPKNQPWVEKARPELLRFDSGVNDDYVDCFAWMIRMAQRMPLVERYNAREAWGNEKSVKDMLEDYARDQESTSDTGYMSA